MAEEIRQSVDTMFGYMIVIQKPEISSEAHGLKRINSETDNTNIKYYGFDADRWEKFVMPYRRTFIETLHFHLGWNGFKPDTCEERDYLQI